MKRWWPRLLLILACVPVLLALVKPGFYITHDGEFNLVRLMHFDQELKRGQFPVRWAYDLDYKLGSPIFSFFYPLMYYLSALIHLFGPDYGASLKILIALATVGSVMTMYTWLRGHFKTLAAFFGALLYLFVPYRLLVMYVTGSFGILLSLFFLPLAFLAVDKIISGRRAYFWLLPISILGLLTSHNVTALLFLPVVASYSLITLLTIRPKGKVWLNIVLGWLIGLGLAATFWLPALLETKYVFLSSGVAVDFRDHFPTLKQLIYSKWDYFYSVKGEGDGLSFQVGMAQWLVAGLTTLILIAGLTKKRKLEKKSFLAAVFLLIYIFSIFMMLSQSDFVWEKITILSQIQFPWRILAVAIISVPFMGAFIAEKRFGKALALLIMALLLWNNRNYLRTWETIRYSDASYRARDGFYYGSTDIAWETRPIWALDKPIWIAKEITVPNPLIKIVAEQTQANGNINIQTSATAAAELAINRFYYPTWETKIDGKTVSVKPTKSGGLIAVDLAVGNHQIEIKQGKTGLEKWADDISIFSLLCLAIWLRKSSS